VVDAGDAFFKRLPVLPPEADRKSMVDKAQVVLESLNLMGYDALGIGEEDLTFGKEVLLDLSRKAKFPFLCANLFDESTGKRLFQASMIKEVNGLKIGLFSVLGPDLFTLPDDPRKKGLTIRNPNEVISELIKELQPKTDVLVLLSHLGYTKDMELAQSVSGIDIIAGSHTGMNLSYPPVVKNTILLQTGLKGMFAARFDFTLYNNHSTPYNVMTKRSYENNLNLLKNRMNGPQVTEAEKAQFRRSIEDVERKLREMQGKNEFTNTISGLTEATKENPDIAKLVSEYKSKYPEPSAPAPTK